jgi:hypothetical protein
MPHNDFVTARCELKISPQTQLKPELESVLRSYFSESVINDFRVAGGTVSINLALGSKRRAKESLTDNKFVEFLKSFRGDERELRDRLEPLSTSMLANITRQLKIPVRSNATASERVNAIVSYVLSSKKWTGISGAPPSSSDAAAE